MKRLALMLTTVAAISLGGCGIFTPGGSTGSGTGNAFLDQVIGDIQGVCSVVIGLTDIPGIQALIGTLPFGSSAISVATLACNAFKTQAPKSVRLRLSHNVVAYVNGVRITGTIQ